MGLNTLHYHEKKMNWLKTIISQKWLEKHPNYTVKDHLHSIFSILLTSIPASSLPWGVNLDLPSPPDKNQFTPDEVYYIPEVTLIDKTDSAYIVTFYFMRNLRTYSSDCVIISSYSEYNSSIEYIKQAGFSGTIKRLMNDGQQDPKELGKIKTPDPYNFCQKTIALIQSDKDDNNENKDLIPDWPYPESEFDDNEDVSNSRVRGPRIRGLV